MTKRNTNSTAEQSRNTPQLRFPEFKDKWNEEKMGEIYSFKVTNSFSRDNLNYEEGTVKNIHYGDIHTKFQTLFDITKETVPFVNSDISIDRISEDNYCKGGDLILADASEDLNDVGKSIEMFNLNNERLLAGLHTILARPNLEKLNIGFGGYLFKSNKVRTKIQKEAQGSKVLSVSATRLTNISLDFPSKDEQKKIVVCFSSIDEKIQALKKKHRLLEQYKKGIMQRLFLSESGCAGLKDKQDETEKNPTIIKSSKSRFRQDDGNDFPKWKIKKLSSIAEKRIVKNRDNAISRVFTNSALHGIVNQRDFFDKDIANQNNLMGYYLVEKNDFVYNPRISNHAPVGPISRNHLGTGIMSPLYTVFRFNEGNVDFLEYLFYTSIWHKHMEDISNYGARDDRMSFLSADFYEMPIPFPSMAEQEQIVLFLSAIDKKVEFAAFEVRQLEKWKKGLLQKMFC